MDMKLLALVLVGISLVGVVLAAGKVTRWPNEDFGKSGCLIILLAGIVMALTIYLVRNDRADTVEYIGCPGCTYYEAELEGDDGTHW